MKILNKLGLVSILVLINLTILTAQPTGWLFKKGINISNERNSSTLIDYQIKVIIEHATLVNSGKSRADGGDIRFLDTDNSTNLNYWIESGVNTVNCIIWVKVPSISANTTKNIYLYYGNSSAISQSNGDATFVFFDHFDGSSVDWSKWLMDWHYVNASNYSILVSSSEVTIGSGTSNPTPSTERHLHCNTNYSISGGIRTKARIKHPNWGGIGPTGRNAIFMIQSSDHTTDYNIHSDPEGFQAQHGPDISNIYNPTNYLLNEILYLPSSRINYYVNNDLIHTESIVYSNLMRPGLAAHNWSTSTPEGKIVCDWIFVGKYCENEPVITLQNEVQLPIDLSNGLVAYYPFNGNANDESGNGYDLSMNNTSFGIDRFGNYNTSITCNGTNSITFSNSLLTNVYNNFCVSIWFKTNTTHEIDPETNSGVLGTVNQKYLNYPHPGDEGLGSGHVGVGISAGTNGVSIYEHAYNHMPSTLVLQQNLEGWIHLVVNYYNKIPYLYINGVYIKSGLNSQYNYIHPSLKFGGGAWGYFQGLFDDIRIYNRNLLETEIQSLYNESNPANIKISGQITNGGVGLNGVNITISGGKDSTMTTTTDGRYSFMVVRGGNYTVTLRKAGYTFSPDSITFNNVSNNQTQNFIATPTTLSTGLIAYYPFNGNANDESGSGYNLIMNNISFNADRFGNYNRSIASNGTNSSLSNASSLTNVNNNFCVSIWFKPNTIHEIDVESNYGISGENGQKYLNYPQWGDPLGDSHVGMGISAGTNGVSIYEHRGNHLAPTLVLQQNIEGWTHLVVNYSNKIPYLYINGTYIKSGLNSQFNYIHPSLIFGGDAWGYFSGLFDDVRIYNRELTNEEISRLYSEANPANIKISGQITNGGVGLNGVTVTLSGDKDSVMTTSTDGRYSFMVVNGNYTVTPTRTGFSFTPSSRTFNNINSSETQDFVVPPDSCTISGNITNKGIALGGVILALSGGMVKSIQTDSNGYYSFTVKKERTYAITPNLNGYSFIPASQTFENITGSQTQNFTALYNSTISLNKESLNYGSVNYLAGSIDSTIIINDTNSQNLVISSYYFKNNKKFSILEDFPLIISARSSKNITVRFNPDSVGFFSDSLHLVNNSYNNPDAIISMQSSVVGSNISATSNNINFGNVGKNSDSRDTTILIKNDGPCKLKIFLISINSQTDTSFKIISSLPSGGVIIDPNSYYELRVRLRPDSIGQKNCSVVVLNNSQNSPSYSITLATNITPPNLVITPANIIFRTTSNILPKDTAVLKIQALSNIVIYKKSISGDTNSFRFLRNFDNINLSPGSVDSVIIEFYPRTVGTKSAILTIKNSDPLAPNQYVNLTGIGSGSSKLFVSLQNIDFGDVVTRIPKDTFLIIRNDGNLALNIINKDIIGTDKDIFSIIKCKSPITLDYKQTDTVKISVLGSLHGTKTAQLQIQNDDQTNNLYKVGLIANIITPIIVKSTDRIIFTGANIGLYCDSVFNIRNTGNSPLILNLSIDGPASSDFTIKNYLSLITILPLKDTNITVRFTPSDTGKRIARVAIKSNDPVNNEVSIMLEGNGKGSIPNITNIISPANNSLNVSTNPVIKWTTSSGATSYHLQISTDTNLLNLFKDLTNLSDTSAIVSNLNPNSSYFARVRGVNSMGTGVWSGIIKFTTIQPITLTSPANNSSQIPISVDLRFEWTKSNNATYYWLQVSSDEHFLSSRDFEVDEKFSNTYYILKKGSMYNNTNYYWRVKSINDGGESDWSDVWKFSTQQGRPNKPNIYKPGNNATQIDTSITVKWFNTGDVSSYIFEISSDKYFKTILYHLTSSENSITINSLSYAATYYCRVKGVNGSEEGDWSDVSSFTTLSNKNEKKHWSCLTDENSINTGKIYRFYLDEINNVVYALAENGLYILQTTEKGITLSKVGKNDITSVKSIIITTKKDIIVSAGSGIWKLRNNDWILVFSCSEDIILNYDKNKNEISGSYGSKITRSIDDGNIWVVENLYSFITDNCTRIDKVISANGKTYVSTTNKSSDCISGKVEIYQSTNNGIIWQSTGFNGKDNVTSISAIIPNSNGGILISTNYGLYGYDGANWAKLNLSGFNITSFIQSLLGDYFAALFGRGSSFSLLTKNSNDGSKFITTSDSLIDGIYRSKDLGKTWECISSGLMETEITAMDFSSTGELWVGTNSGSFYKTVIKQTNAAPYFTSTISNMNASLNQNIEIVFSASDENLDKLTFSISNNPSGSTLEKLTDNTYIFKWMPSSTGTFNNITVNVSDGQLSVSQSFNIVVTNNRPPVISTVNGVTEYSTIENKSISFNITYSDPDNDPIKFTAEGTSLISGARIDSISPNLRQLNWTPTLAGSYTLNISVSDGKASASIKIGITVKKTNRAPGSFTLLSPADFSTISLVYPTKPITFVWQKSVDPDIGDIVNYKFKLKGTGFSLDTIIQNQENQNISVTFDIMKNLKPAVTYQWYAIASDGMDSTFSSNPLMFSTSSSVTDVTTTITKVENFYLKQNYPNPFNPETRIQYSISEDVFVNLKIFDVYGREIETLVSKVQSAGTYSVNWLPKDLPSGVYYYKIIAGRYNEIKKMNYIR